MAERAALSRDDGNPIQEMPTDAEPRPEPAHRGPAAVVAYGSVRMHPSARVTNVCPGPLDTVPLCHGRARGESVAARFIDGIEQVP